MKVVNLISIPIIWKPYRKS